MQMVVCQHEDLIHVNTALISIHKIKWQEIECETNYCTFVKVHCAVLSCFSHVRLFAPLWTVAREVLQARILEWVAMLSSRGSSHSRDLTVCPLSPALQADSLPTGASLVAQIVNCLPAMQKNWVWTLGRKIPWWRKWQPTPVLLPGKFHGQSSLVGYSPWGCKESFTTEQLHFLSLPAEPSGKPINSLWNKSGEFKHQIEKVKITHSHTT